MNKPQCPPRTGVGTNQIAEFWQQHPRRGLLNRMTLFVHQVLALPLEIVVHVLPSVRIGTILLHVHKLHQ